MYREEWIIWKKIMWFTHEEFLALANYDSIDGLAKLKLIPV